MRDFLEGRKRSRHMGGALEVGRKDAACDRIQGSTCEGTTMLTHMVFQVISTLTHRALRGPISRERVAHGRTLKRMGATTATSVTLRTGRAVSALRVVGALGVVGTLGVVGALMSTLRM